MTCMNSSKKKKKLQIIGRPFLCLHNILSKPLTICYVNNGDVKF